MNWEAIGAVGEILGALAVVLTLAYLAKQTKMSHVVAAGDGKRPASNARCGERELPQAVLPAAMQVGEASHGLVRVVTVERTDARIVREALLRQNVEGP